MATTEKKKKKKTHYIWEDPVGKEGIDWIICTNLYSKQRLKKEQHEPWKCKGDHGASQSLFYPMDSFVIQANVLCSSHLYQLLQLCALILCLLTSSTFHLGLISAHQWLLLRGYLSWNYLSLAQRTTLAQLFLVAAARSSLHEHVHPPTASGSSELDIISFYQLCLDMDAPAINEIPKHLGAKIRMIKKKKKIKIFSHSYRVCWTWP